MWLHANTYVCVQIRQPIDINSICLVLNEHEEMRQENITEFMFCLCKRFFCSVEHYPIQVIQELLELLLIQN